MKVLLGEKRSLVVCLSAEEEEEEEKSRVKSEGRWSATPLGEEACCASWRSVSALRPRHAKLGFTPTTGQSG